MQDFEKNTDASVAKEDRIKNILEKTENDIKTGKITRRSGEGGAEEFVFSADGTGLVFDKELPENEKPAPAAAAPSADESTQRGSLDAYEKEAPRVEEVTLVSRTENEVIAVDLPADAEEFSLPSSFKVDEKYNTPIREERRTVYSTYVPKFTDASENYRMADQPREQKKIPRPFSVDPTAEEERETEDAVVIGVGEAPASAEAILNVSKPAAAEAAPAEKPVRTEADERAQIESLLKRYEQSETPAAEVPEIAAEEPQLQETPAFFAPESEAQVPPSEPYVMPDPDEGTVRIFDYPEDVGERSLPTEAETSALSAHRTLFSPKEYVNVGQKMAFKDMFLDRLNSVAVRLAAALLLTLILFVIENLHLIGVDAVAFLGFQEFPFALALLDMQVVLCLLLLASPEIMRGIRALTKGLFHSVLFLPIAFLLQILHTVAVMVTRPSVSLLYGFVFGLAVLATIVGSYLRHQAAFITFRHVGGREEKLAVEKKMTRTLEKENHALDGAVDEYKSKTARFLRTSFIQDFFARERKSSENTRHNLKYLLISLGISLVGAIVMFFIGDGMISAASTLTVTFYLSTPAALLLAHRLPFYFSARAASAEGGGVIGETSHYDYAGVDVVCFRDTEIFEKGDVSLKHIILYDAAKEFTSVVEQMSSLFSVIGGPLNVLFSESLVRKCPPADDAVLENGGICGRIGSDTFHVGSASYMASKGIALPREKDNRETLDVATVMMYAAENGRVYAKFYLQYRLSFRFESLLPSFDEEKIVSLVYTRDPNVSGELMRHLASGRDLIRLIKEEAETTMPDAQERISVGLVSTRDKTSAISLLLLCRRYVKMQKNLLSAFWFALGSGAFLGIMLSVFGLLALPSAAYGLWQIALVVAMAIYAKKALSKPKNTSVGGSKNQ